MLLRAEWRRRIRRFSQRRKNDLIYVLALLGLWLFRRIPLALSIRVGSFLGWVAYCVLRTERARALEHLCIAFPQEKSQRERRRIARRSFQNLGRNAAEVVNYYRIKGDLDRYITVVGEEHLDRALAQGMGVLWITAHLGNWELLACYWAQRGYRLNVVARGLYDERLNRLLLRFRKEAGVAVILRDSPTAGRGILKALKRKECLAMLIDQDTKVKGVMVDFFGRKANTPAGPALLACRKPIPVIAGFIHRVTDRSHEIVICPPVEIVRTGNEVQDVEVNTERFNKILENYIRRYPEQWVWMHRRWRRQMPYQGVSARQPADAVSI